MSKVTWRGSNPSNCQICHIAITHEHGFVDGKTLGGPWAIMCCQAQGGCAAAYGVGLGLSLGQRYAWSDEDQKWVKVEG
jgi:hypothetical protein